MIPSIIIFFREGLEASLIVSILLSYLYRIGQPSKARIVWAGVVAAVVLDLALGIGLFHVIHQYDGSRLQTILEGTTYFVATVMLTGMSFWMKTQSRNLKASLEHRMEVAISQGTILTLAALSFITVGREGLETVFFTLAVAFHASVAGLAGGALVGVAIAITVDWAIFHAGYRLPLSQFFAILGVVLLVFAGALLADGIEDFQALGWLPLLTHVVWHSGQLLNENSLFGDILHNFIGYADSPTVLQIGAYVCFLGAAIWTYLRRSTHRTTASPASH